MNEYYDNYTLLKELNVGDRYITKLDSECIYLKWLGEDRHLVFNIDAGTVYEVPHGRFPVFKIK